jgi:hypothetical protein
MTNNKLIKFIANDYIKNDSLELDSEGNITICNTEITFMNLEFNSNVIISIVSLVLSKDSTYSILDEHIYNFNGMYESSHPYSIKFENITSYNFSNCKFNDDVYFNLLDNCALELEYCIFEKNFNINKDTDPQQKTNRTIKINRLVIDNCVFKSTFIFESCIVNEYRIIDIKLEEDAKFFDIEFYTMFENTSEEEVAYFTNTIFHKSAIFEKVVFKECIQFKYTFFKGYTLFRDVIFENGLNLDYASIENEINFFNLQGLDSEKSKKITSQETYRIIKYQFDKIGNRRESNKYHALELEKNNSSNFQDWIIFKLQWWSSRHTTNWILPLLYITLVSLVSIAFLHLDLLIKVSYNPNLFKFEYIINILNEFPKYIYILYKGDDLLSLPWVLVFNKFSLGYLYYQFLLSVRRYTRK